MRVSGVDFTRAPGRRKPLVAVGRTFARDVLRAEHSEKMTSLEELEGFPDRSSPWVRGLDFPSGSLAVS